MASPVDKQEIVVYLASHYSRKNEVRKAAKELTDLGIIVSSSWFHEPYNPKGSLWDTSDAAKRRIAKKDLAELSRATHFVLFSVDPDLKFTRGGHCYEDGWSARDGHAKIVVGPRQHIFHYLPGTKRVDTWEQAKRWLLRERKRLGSV